MMMRHRRECERPAHYHEKKEAQTNRDDDRGTLERARSDDISVNNRLIEMRTPGEVGVSGGPNQ